MKHACRICGHELSRPFIDLGTAPPSNAYLTEAELHLPEVYYPLKVYVCEHCLLVQLPEHVHPGSIFGREYLYFSSYSKAWVEHAKRYVEQRIEADSPKFVVELASNDGYLLQHFVERGVKVLGVEPAPNVASVAVAKGIPTLCKFFGRLCAEEITKEHGKADLICGANVLAHVPDLHDFVEGMRRLLAPGGLITMEFPHLGKLIESCAFDTIYHEHFSYFSLPPLHRLLDEHQLAIDTVEELPTHGGSIRIHVRHASAVTARSILPGALMRLEAYEAQMGLLDARSDAYGTFQQRAETYKNKLVGFLANSKSLGLRGAGFGAPAKANTFLNYAGIRSDLLSFVVDDNPHKQGRFMPGSRIPIRDSLALAQAAMDKLDWVLILPWNLYDELRPKVRSLVGPHTRIVNPVSWSE